MTHGFDFRAAAAGGYSWRCQLCGFGAGLFVTETELYGDAADHASLYCQSRPAPPPDPPGRS